MQELRNSVGVTSHLVALLQPCKVLQSMAKQASGQFEMCAWLKLYRPPNLSDHGDEQENWVLKIVCEGSGSTNENKAVLLVYLHRSTTAPCQALFVARLLYFENNSYSFYDADCHGHTRSRPEEPSVLF